MAPQDLYNVRRRDITRARSHSETTADCEGFAQLPTSAWGQTAFFP